MKIAIFTDSFLPQINGIVTSTINLIKRLADRGHKIIIIAPKIGGKEFNYKNVKVKRIGSIPALFYPEFKFTSPLNLDIVDYLKKEKVDLIHFQTPLTLGISAIIASKILKLPLIGTFHTDIVQDQYLKHIKINPALVKHLSRLYLRSYYNRCNLITCPSESIKKKIISEGLNKNIKVISNGIDPSIFYNGDWKKVRKKYTKKGKIILFFGRIAHEKNIFYLLDCFNLVLKKIPDVKLLIVGDGPQMKSLREKIKSENLKNNVILVGKIEHSKFVKSSILKASDIFVTASLTETQGITLLEAQANGLPSVGIDAQGTKDLIKNGYNGFLVKKEDKNAFANAVIKLLSNKNLYLKMRKNALKEIKKHEMPNIISEWEKTYLKTIKDYNKK